MCQNDGYKALQKKDYWQNIIEGSITSNKTSLADLAPV